MSDKPLGDALSKPIVIPDLPENEVVIAAEQSQGDAGVSVTANVDVGKPGGWFVGGQGGWWQSLGYSVKGWIGWKPRPKP